ncbi:MAG TPA: translocation/assembly module TamB domain-containing protein [Moraxellaceae bacterium]|nr:translocation/assembly module TamB domain-containing protein [Moraxellaceae bacterium]
MWHHHVRRAGRHLWRLVLASLVLALALAGALLAVLGSETGSRWLLEQGLGMQRSIEARYQGGTFLGGLELSGVRYRSASNDLQVRRLLARWSLWGLLRGRVEMSRLELEGVDLRRLTPPGPDKTTLPVLLLPLRLHLAAGQASDIRFWPWAATHPYTLRRLALADTDWSGTRVRFGALQADHDRIGQLALAGRIRLRGGYPLEATGRLDYLPFRARGWGPVQVRLAREVADLELRLKLQGPAAVVAQGRVQPLEKQIPYTAQLRWPALVLPWWSDQQIRSEGGDLRLQGNRDGLQAQGQAQLSGRHLPAGKYALKGRTDWHSAQVEALDFNGLGGNANVAGEVRWRSGLAWTLRGRLQNVDLARKWPVPRLALPVLTGDLDFNGKTSSGGGAVRAALRLAGGERWDLTQQSDGWAWNLAARQQLAAQWHGVRRTLKNGQTIYADSGRLEAFGHRNDWRAQIDTALAGERLPPGQWVATLQGQRRQVVVPRLDYSGEAGALGFQGELALGAPLRWSGRLVLDHLATGWLSPEWSGQLSGEVTGQGAWGERRRDFQLSRVQLEGRLRERPFSLQGPLDIQLRDAAWPALYSPRLEALWGENRALVAGGLREGTWDMAAELALGDLSLLVPGVRGSVGGQLGLSGPERRPDIQAHLTGSGLGRAGMAVQSARLDATVMSLGDRSSQVVLATDGLTTSSGRDWGQVTLALDGTRDQHALDWRIDSDQVTGRGALSGGLATDGWRGTLAAGQVAVAGLEWRLDAPFALAWRQGMRQLTLAPHCWRSGAATLCNQDEARVGRAGHVRLELAGLALERLRHTWPEGLEVAGQVNGQVTGDWAPGESPLLRAVAEARDGQVRLLRDEGLPPLVRTFERLSLSADAGLQAVNLGLDLVSQDMGQGQARVRIDPRAPGKPLTGDVALHGLRLGVFQPFFPGLATLSGLLSAEGRLGGVLARPAFEGQVRVEDGELAFLRLPLHVRNLVTRIDVRGTRADISGSMKSGPGGATLSGAADWSDEPRLELALKGERFQLSQPPELQAEVDPDLSLKVAPYRVDLTGSLFVPTGRLNLKRLTDQAVPLSPDVRVVLASDREAAQLAGRVKDWNINADVRLRLGEEVYFQGFGVTGRLAGGLRLRQEGRRGLEASGEVELDKESRYDAYGQRLQIRRGRLIFAGNLSQPGLDVEAIRTVDDKVVGVRVQGRANQPEAMLFSDTAMSQEEIVSYLVLGRPLDTQGRPEAAGNLTAAAAAIKLGATGAGGLGVTNKVGETLGISDFSVDAEGSGDDTQFTVSGYISPKLYLRYGVGIFTPVNTATLRYKINSRLYLEAVSSLDSTIDLFYNLRF